MIEEIKRLAAELQAKIGAYEASQKKDCEQETSELKQFEVGKWYSSTGCLFNYQGLYSYGCFEGYISAFGIGADNEWREVGRGHWGLPEHNQIIPATQEEVERALIKEAERRGFDGGKVIIPYFPEHSLAYAGRQKYKMNNIPPRYFADKIDNDVLRMGGSVIYCKGEWAEVVKEDVIMICGKEVEFVENGVNIDGVHYPLGLLNQIRSVIKTPGIKSLNVGCNGQEKVDLDLINKIIDRCEKV